MERPLPNSYIHFVSRFDTKKTKFIIDLRNVTVEDAFKFITEHLENPENNVGTYIISFPPIQKDPPEEGNDSPSNEEEVFISLEENANTSNKEDVLPSFEEVHA